MVFHNRKYISKREDNQTKFTSLPVISTVEYFSFRRSFFFRIISNVIFFPIRRDLDAGRRRQTQNCVSFARIRLLSGAAAKMVNRVLQRDFNDGRVSPRRLGTGRYFIMQICFCNQTVCINLNCAMLVRISTEERKRVAMGEYRSNDGRSGETDRAN